MQDVRQLLTALRGRYNQTEMAHALGITTRTLRRWEVGESDPPPYAADAIRQRLLPLTGTDQGKNHDFRFIDCQQATGHLLRFGAVQVRRNEFLRRLEAAREEEGMVGKWGGIACDPK